MSPRINLYETIVDAAEAVVIELGAAHMTLDAVAAKAGVSRGGILHHFPTKVTLLEAMISRLIEARMGSREKIWGELPDSPARGLKAQVLSALLRDKRSVGAPLLAVLAHDPRPTEPVREAIRRSYTEIAPPDVKFEKAAVLALAADGLVLLELLRVSPFSEEQRSKVAEELLRIADEVVAGRENESL